MAERVLHEGVGELLQLGEAQARWLRVVRPVLTLRIEALIQEVGVRLAEVAQWDGWGEAGGQGALWDSVLLPVEAVLRQLIVMQTVTVGGVMRVGGAMYVGLAVCGIMGTAVLVMGGVMLGVGGVMLCVGRVMLSVGGVLIMVG